jgi:hypothetical protein
MDPMNTYLLVLASYAILYLLVSFVYRYYFQEPTPSGPVRESASDRRRGPE